LLSQNVSGLSSMLRHFRKDFPAFTLLAVQETWVSKARNSLARQSMPTGLIFGGSHAIPSSKGGRPSAGVGFVWASTLPVCNPGGIYNDPRRFSVEYSGCTYVSFYGPQNIQEGYRMVNDTLLQLQARGQPFVLVGDFNIGAAHMSAWLAEQGMDTDFHVVSPGPTCFQNPAAPTAIDYAIIPAKLLAALGPAQVRVTSLDVPIVSPYASRVYPGPLRIPPSG
jgi:exonuclease III